MSILRKYQHFEINIQINVVSKTKSLLPGLSARSRFSAKGRVEVMKGRFFSDALLLYFSMTIKISKQWLIITYKLTEKTLRPM